MSSRFVLPCLHLLFALALAPAWAGTAQTTNSGAGERNVQSSDIGIVRTDGNGGILLFSARSISASDAVYMQYPDKVGKVTCCARAIVASGRHQQAEALVTDEHLGRDVWVYKLRKPAQAAFDMPFVGAAVVGNPADVRGDRGDLRFAEIGVATVVTSCASSEGLHFVARRGRQIQAHLYLNLEYDTESNCSTDALK